MEKFINFVTEKPILTAAGVGIAIYSTYKMSQLATGIIIGRAMDKMDKRPKHYEDGIVYLHAFPPTFIQHLNMSPFAIKIQTWLRLHKIPHQVSHLEKLTDQ